MTIFIAAIGGLGTWLGLCVALAFAQGYLRGTCGMATVLLSYQPWKLGIQVACWFAAAWVGFSVFDALGGL